MPDTGPDRADRLATHIRSTPGTWMPHDALGVGQRHSVLEWYRAQGITGHLWDARTDLATIAERYPDLLTRREGHRHTYDTPEGASS